MSPSSEAKSGRRWRLVALALFAGLGLLVGHNVAAPGWHAPGALWAEQGPIRDR